MQNTFAQAIANANTTAGKEIAVLTDFGRAVITTRDINEAAQDAQRIKWEGMALGIEIGSNTFTTVTPDAITFEYIELSEVTDSNAQTFETIEEAMTTQHANRNLLAIIAATELLHIGQRLCLNSQPLFTTYRPKPLITGKQVARLRAIKAREDAKIQDATRNAAQFTAALSTALAAQEKANRFRVWNVTTGRGTDSTTRRHFAKDVRTFEARGLRFGIDWYVAPDGEVMPINDDAPEYSDQVSKQISAGYWGMQLYGDVRGAQLTEALPARKASSETGRATGWNVGGAKKADGMSANTLQESGKALGTRRTQWKATVNVKTAQHEGEAPAKRAVFPMAAIRPYTLTRQYHGEARAARTAALLASVPATPSTERHTANAMPTDTTPSTSFMARRNIGEVMRQKDAKDTTTNESAQAFRERVKGAMTAYLYQVTKQEGPLQFETQPRYNVADFKIQMKSEKKRAKLLYTVTLADATLEAMVTADGIGAMIYRLEEREANEATDFTRHDQDDEGEDIPETARLTAKAYISRKAPHLTPERTNMAVRCESEREARQWHAHLSQHLQCSPVRAITTAEARKVVSKPTFSEAWSEEADSDEMRLSTRGAFFIAYNVELATLPRFTSLRPETHHAAAIRVSARIYATAQANGLTVAQLPDKLKRTIGEAIRTEGAKRSKWLQDPTATGLDRYRTEKLTRMINAQRTRLAYIWQELARLGKAQSDTSRATRAQAIEQGTNAATLSTRRTRFFKQLETTMPDAITTRPQWKASKGKQVKRVLDTTHKHAEQVATILDAYMQGEIDTKALNRVLSLLAEHAKDIETQTDAPREKVAA